MALLADLKGVRLVLLRGKDRSSLSSHLKSLLSLNPLFVTIRAALGETERVCVIIFYKIHMQYTYIFVSFLFV